MPRFANGKIGKLFARADGAASKAAKGKLLEDIACYTFERVPGIANGVRNTLNQFATEELDVAFWNEKRVNGFYFLPHSILLECKNWSAPVDSQAVSYFASRLRQRGLDHGVLLAANGITGDPSLLSAAHYEVGQALTAGIKLLVVTRGELEALIDTEDLVDLLKQKLCQLFASGTCLRTRS